MANHRPSLEAVPPSENTRLPGQESNCAEDDCAHVDQEGSYLLDLALRPGIMTPATQNRARGRSIYLAVCQSNVPSNNSSALPLAGDAPVPPVLARQQRANVGQQLVGADRAIPVIFHQTIHDLVNPAQLIGVGRFH